MLQAVDKDKDGVISVEEFKLFFECLGLEEKVK
jgi:Ca2+-binding EF-hand superfamily protein